ncbi:MAG: glycosyltransferase [Weeksellaceae bacterium]|nr:glycosyltransferase [Weeksellaceae bacterium]
MTQKIKILHIQETIGSGGVERRRLSMAKHLDKMLFDQRFICTIEKGNIPDEIRAQGFQVTSIGKMKSPLHWKQHRKIQKIIDEFNPDIIHGAVFEGVTLAALNGWLKKVPIIIIEETSFPINRTWKGNLLVKLFSRLSTKVIGVSEAVSEEYLKQKLGLAEKKVILINNGVAAQRVVSSEELQAVRDKYQITPEAFVIGSVGRMLDDSNKRFSDLIKAFASFSQDKPNARLLLIGEGPEKKNYETLSKQLGIEKKVIFTGYQSDVAIFYQLMDVFAIASLHESFGLVLAEAMLNKLPVIAAKVGGMKYIVDDGKTGLLVAPGNTNAILDAFNTLYKNSTMLTQFGMNGYEKAMKEYTEESYVQNVANLYNSLMKQAK